MVAERGDAAVYLTLDDETAQGAARRDPQGFLRDLRGRNAVIDEAQRVPELFLPIKREVDEHRVPWRFLLTGSANALFLPRLAEALVGRAQLFTMWPLAQTEIESGARNLVDDVFAPELPDFGAIATSRSELARRIVRGGFPEAHTLATARLRANWFRAYVTLLLIGIANPYGRSVRDLSLVRRWAGMWAPLVALHPLDDEYEVPPYLVEFTKDQALHPAGSADSIGSDARWLDTARLGLQISHMLSQLQQRLTPSQLGLGEETSGHVRRLLENLSRPWTQTASPRRFRRFASDGTAKVAVGFEAIHYFVGGKEFTQPDSGSIYGRGQFDEVFTFRDRVAPGQALNIKPR
ncbi:MAG TPA: AAA family ATPase, partial [Bryobacteraceae bacterium]|nr:AAA family ATPase [Bryobacteraceae bacterium]